MKPLKNKIITILALLVAVAYGEGEADSAEVVYTTDPTTWPACSADVSTTCSSDKYFNPVACQCFVKVRCDDECEVGVTAIIPTEICTCAPYAEI